jgi:hypothetical protein
LQRFQAALAFDAVQLELPGIKESDVDPSDLVAKVMQDWEQKLWSTFGNGRIAQPTRSVMDTLPTQATHQTVLMVYVSLMALQKRLHLCLYVYYNILI